MWVLGEGADEDPEKDRIGLFSWFSVDGDLAK